MDADLEQPGELLEDQERKGGDKDQGNASSDEEDGGPDWTKLPIARHGSHASARPVIPKRGEKDFEPSKTGGSALQQHALGLARSSMLSALDVPRTVSSKSVSYGVWVSSLARTYVTVPRGTHFSTMGYSVPRPPPHQETVQKNTDTKDNTKWPKRLELLPEEALYLVERGSMMCYKEDEESQLDLMTYSELGIGGIPMTVQQAYAEMIGREGLTLEKYQVFAYLRRLGFTLTRAEPPDPFYPNPASLQSKPIQNGSILSRWISGCYQLIARYLRVLYEWRRDWWKPLPSPGWLRKYSSHASIFETLRIIPSGFRTPSQSSQLPSTLLATPYRVFFNLYKPSTPFRKTVPPAPDFSIVVVDARSTPMPTLEELSSLFESLPDYTFSPPKPRGSKPAMKEAKSLPKEKPAEIDTSQTWWFSHLLYRVSCSFGFGASHQSTVTLPQWKPHPMQVLKTGKKIVVIAAVDAGTISFFRFGQGGFSEIPIV